MGLPGDVRDVWAAKRQSFLIPSPNENNSNAKLTPEEEKILRAKRCTDDGVREGVKAAGIACVASSIPTVGVSVLLVDGLICYKFVRFALDILKNVSARWNLSRICTSLTENRWLEFFIHAEHELVAVRVIPWAKANLNYTAQALIISAASIATYFIVAEKTILACSRQNSIEQYKIHDMKSE